jgi:hypothetical protein
MVQTPFPCTLTWQFFTPAMRIMASARNRQAIWQDTTSSVRREYSNDWMDTWQNRRIIYDMPCWHEFPLRAQDQKHVARDVILLLTCPSSWSLSGRHSPAWLQNRTLIDIAKFPLTSLKVKRYFIPGCKVIRFQDALSSDTVRPQPQYYGIQQLLYAALWLISTENLIHSVAQNNYHFIESMLTCSSEAKETLSIHSTKQLTVHTCKLFIRPAVAEEVSRRLPTATPQVRSRVRSCAIYGGQIGTGVGFLRVLRFRLEIFIPLIAQYSLIILSSILYSLDTDRFVK